MGKYRNFKRGDIHIADFGNARGSYKSGIRPVLIVSRSDLSSTSPVVLVAPLTTMKEKHVRNSYYSDVVLEKTARNNLRDKSIVQCGELQTIDKEQILFKIGSIDRELREIINEQLLKSVGV